MKPLSPKIHFTSDRQNTTGHQPETKPGPGAHDTPLHRGSAWAVRRTHSPSCPIPPSPQTSTERQAHRPRPQTSTQHSPVRQHTAPSGCSVLHPCIHTMHVSTPPHRVLAHSSSARPHTVRSRRLVSRTYPAHVTPGSELDIHSTTQPPARRPSRARTAEHEAHTPHQHRRRPLLEPRPARPTRRTDQTHRSPSSMLPTAAFKRQLHLLAVRVIHAGHVGVGALAPSCVSPCPCQTRRRTSHRLLRLRRSAR